MKSAYELAMERLAKSDPDSAKPLTSEQKQALADIETLFKSRLAEQEITLKQRIADAEARGDSEEVEKAREMLRIERLRIEEDMEAEKGKVRQQN